MASQSILGSVTEDGVWASPTGHHAVAEIVLIVLFGDHRSISLTDSQCREKETEKRQFR